MKNFSCNWRNEIEIVVVIEETEELQLQLKKLNEMQQELKKCSSSSSIHDGWVVFEMGKLKATQIKWVLLFKVFKLIEVLLLLLLCMCISYVYLAARYIHTFDDHHHHTFCVFVWWCVFFVHLWYFCSGLYFLPKFFFTWRPFFYFKFSENNLISVETAKVVVGYSKYIQNPFRNFCIMG